MDSHQLSMAPPAIPDKPTEARPAAGAARPSRSGPRGSGSAGPQRRQWGLKKNQPNITDGKLWVLKKNQPP
ncbi:hypothetical protein, partial [Achromobacter insolitus]|uniref:hypothetical protein n=1 Tax=Achromobacter insolitus TaxID=217204 RepID=UPI00366EE58D